MNFTRKGDLYIPEEPITKGRSMVGYSRRSFFGLLAAFAIAPIPCANPATGGFFVPPDLVRLLINAGHLGYPMWIEIGSIREFRETEKPF